MMSGEAWLYLLAVLINAVNLFLQVFFTIMYSDLEWYAISLSYFRHAAILLHRNGVAKYSVSAVTTSTLSTFATA